jgi:uridylate kinase
VSPVVSPGRGRSLPLIYRTFMASFPEIPLKAVVKLGGALFKRDPEVEALKSMGKTLSSFVNDGNQLVAVAGGGQNARVYIDAARKLGADESTCDLIGIGVTRSNAELLRLALGGVGVPKIPTLLSELNHLAGPGKAVVLGGLQPGQSTNAVAALAAEITRADFLVNATDVDGVYTSDPKKDPKAKLLRSISVEKLLNWALAGDVYAGKYELLDPVALKIMQRGKIPTRFVSLEDPSNITSALRGRDIGTLVSYS